MHQPVDGGDRFSIDTERWSALPPREVDRVLDIHRAVRDGRMTIEEARVEVASIDPLLLEDRQWLLRAAICGIRNIEGLDITKSDIARMSGWQEHRLLSLLVKMGVQAISEEEVRTRILRLYPQLLQS